MDRRARLQHWACAGGGGLQGFKVPLLIGNTYMAFPRVTLGRLKNVSETPGPTGVETLWTRVREACVHELDTPVVENKEGRDKTHLTQLQQTENINNKQKIEDKMENVRNFTLSALLKAALPLHRNTGCRKSNGKTTATAGVWPTTYECQFLEQRLNATSHGPRKVNTNLKSLLLKWRLGFPNGDLMSLYQN